MQARAKPYFHTSNVGTGPSGRLKCTWAAQAGEIHDRCFSWNGCAKKCYRQQQELSRRRTATGIRKFPMPKHANSGGGFCRWCGEAITNSDGKINKRRTWHKPCLEAYFLHTRMDDQKSFLIGRDGPACSACGEVKGRWRRLSEHGDLDALRRRLPSYERIYPPDAWCGPVVVIEWATSMQVEHTVPLWAVYHLPDEERSIYFGPENITLMCDPCHKIKTAAEARQRAEARKDS